jgi:hypothetical protein
MEREKKWSQFRNWVHSLWVENCEEHSQFGELPYRSQEYWEKYKYWLKREFKHRNKQ